MGKCNPDTVNIKDYPGFCDIVDLNICTRPYPIAFHASANPPVTGEPGYSVFAAAVSAVSQLSYLQISSIKSIGLLKIIVNKK